MFKAIRFEKQILIVLLWSGLIFIGYHVLTAEASTINYDKDEWVGGVTPDEWSDAEKYIDDSREQNKEYCAQEHFYDKNKKFCDKLEKDEDTFEYADEQGSKKICEDNFGEWKASECKFSKDDKEKGYDVDFDHSMEEEGLWDDYALDQRDKKLENICNKVDGKWTKDGCETDNDGPKADKFHELVDKEPGATIQDGEYGVIPFQTPVEPEDEKDSPPVIEDWRNEVSEGQPPQQEIKDDYKLASPIVEVKEEEEESSSYEYEQSSDEYEESSDEEPEEEEEEQEDESEEDNSDSES